MAVMGKKKRIVTLVTVHAILILLVITALFPIALVVLKQLQAPCGDCCQSAVLAGELYAGQLYQRMELCQVRHRV